MTKANSHPLSEAVVEGAFPDSDATVTAQWSPPGNESRLRKKTDSDKKREQVTYNKSSPKVYFERELLESAAFKSLTRVSILVLVRFYLKRWMKPAGREYSDNKRTSKVNYLIENNGRIIYPYSEAVANGFSREQFRNAIDELQRKGFLDITHQGQGGRKPADGETGDVTTYSIDNRWQSYNPETGIADQPPRKPRRADKRKNRGFQKFWAEQKNRS